MTGRVALVTGASGFLGRHLVDALLRKGYGVRAGVRTNASKPLGNGLAKIVVCHVDILDPASLLQAMEGVDIVFHLAALVDSSKTREELYSVNVQGTRNVWECAARSRVRKAMYCSTTAVYGLLARSESPIAEQVQARAIEPYGHSKLLGEHAALEVAARTGLHTTIIRPVAIFGPEEHTPFGRNIRDAAVSKLLIAGGFQGKGFNFVYVEDVARAAIHLMEQNLKQGDIYNVTVGDSIRFEDAFGIYVRVLGRAGRSYAKIWLLGSISLFLHRVPAALGWLTTILGSATFFKIWHPGFDLIYSSTKLQSTSFSPRWTDFEDVLSMCVRGRSR